MIDESSYHELYKNIRCPYCDRTRRYKSTDVFVIFNRLGTCFVNCKGCGQTMGIDKELGIPSKEEEQTGN